MRILSSTLLATLLLSLALAISFPVAQAGDVTDPEVADSADDVALSFGDAVSAWVSPVDAEHVLVGLKIRESPATPGAMACHQDPACLPAGVRLVYQVAFRVAGPDVPDDYNGTFVRATFGNATANWALAFGSWNAAGAETLQGTAVGSAASGVITWTLPRANASVPLPVGEARGYALLDPWAAVAVFRCAPQVGCTEFSVPDVISNPTAQVPPTVPPSDELHSLDRAPDAGFGRNYTFPLPEPVVDEPVVVEDEPEPVANVTEEPEPLPPLTFPMDDGSLARNVPPTRDAPNESNRDAPGLETSFLLAGLVGVALAARRL